MSINHINTIPGYCYQKNMTSIAFTKNQRKKDKIPPFLSYNYIKPPPKTATGYQTGFFKSCTATESVKIKNAREIKIPSEGVNLQCIYSPAAPGKPTVLFCHGNGTNIYETQEVGIHYANKGIGVLMLEYPGYGRTSGWATEQNLYQSAKDGIKFLNSQGVENKDIIAHGHSLGGPVAAYAAAQNTQNPLKALILDSTMPNTTKLVEDWINRGTIVIGGPTPGPKLYEKLCNDFENALFPTEKYLAALPEKTAVMVIHSANDEVIDEEIGKMLIDRAKNSRPDAVTLWEESSESKMSFFPLTFIPLYTSSHQNYDARMPMITNYIQSLS